jgi:hypothetical protein
MLGRFALRSTSDQRTKLVTRPLGPFRLLSLQGTATPRDEVDSKAAQPMIPLVMLASHRCKSGMSMVLGDHRTGQMSIETAFSPGLC